jgi:hypothetical protein
MFKMSRWFVLTIFLMCIILVPFSLLAVEKTKYYMDPRKVIDEITNRSAYVIAPELYDHPDEWRAVLRNIASGNEAWIRVAVALYPGTDAGATDMLTLSVGEALEHEPINVFKIALKEFRLESVCDDPDIDDFRYNSYDLAIEAINLRQKKVSAITDPKLSELCKQCIQILEKSKVDIKRAYDIENYTQRLK